jgi:hypothetical protein
LALKKPFSLEEHRAQWAELLASLRKAKKRKQQARREANRDKHGRFSALARRG